MNKKTQVQDDDIDLFEFFETLWDGKWLISTSVAIAGLLGGGFLLLNDAVYESKVIYSVDSIPPFYDTAKASTDFQNKFYSPSVFDEWKKNNGDVSLDFKDISETEVVDGFVLSKGKGKQLATLTFEKNVGSAVLVKSNQLPILDDVFKYGTHISGLLRNEYVVRAKNELNIIETRIKDFSTANDDVLTQILNIDRYVVSAEKGASVLTFQRPTIPVQVSPKSSLILIMSLFLGAVAGVSLTLLRNAGTKRKERLAKA